MTKATDTKILADLAAEVHRLQTLVKGYQGDIKGHKSHLMDVIAPNGNDDSGPIIVTFGDRTVRVSHKHTIDPAELQRRYPQSKRPELWTPQPNTDVVRALLTDDKVRAMEVCGSSFIVVS